MATYQQLLAKIAQQDAVINNLKVERDWLEQDNDIQRATVTKLQKKVQEWEAYSKFKKEQLNAEINRLSEELGSLKAENERINASNTALLAELGRKNRELRYGMNLGREMYKEMCFYKTEYLELLRIFKPASFNNEGATITEIDNNEVEVPVKDAVGVVILRRFPTRFQYKLQTAAKKTFRETVAVSVPERSFSEIILTTGAVSAVLHSYVVALPKVRTRRPFHAAELPKSAMLSGSRFAVEAAKLPSFPQPTKSAADELNITEEARPASKVSRKRIVIRQLDR